MASKGRICFGYIEARQENLTRGILEGCFSDGEVALSEYVKVSIE